MTDTTQRTGDEIAVIGLAGRFPGARDAESFWSNLAAGVESIRDLTDDEMRASGVSAEEISRPGYVKRGAWLDDVELFDAGFFGLTPREAELMDPQQRLFLECAWEAMEHAGHAPGSPRDRTSGAGGGPVGVFAGGKMGTYIFNLTSDPDLAGLDTVTLGLGNDVGLLAMRVSYLLGLSGPSYFVQTACSTGLVAVHLACQSLLLDECRTALAGAVAIDVPNRRGYVHSPEGILSSDGRVRPFDAGASGTVFGSGLGVVVLKRLDDAVADGDRIWAVIKGTATNNDGGDKPNFTAPGVDGQSEVILRALVNAQVSPESISYVEAHGTGTHLGDPVEIRALTKAWRRLTDRTGFCALGSVKSNVGHLDAAAGMSGLIKTVLALDRGLIPPSLHFERPNPGIDFASTPFHVVSEARRWRSDGAPRRAAVSAFGFGGTNAHAILEEAPPRPAPEPDRGRRVVVLSARSREALEEATDRLADHLEEHPEQPLADVAWTLQTGRRTFPWRRAVVTEDASAAGAADGPDPRAAAIAALRERSAPAVVTGRAESAERPVAYLFSGQGSQHPGMGLGLLAEPGFAERFGACAERLRSLLEATAAETGRWEGEGDLRRLLDPGSDPATGTGTDLDDTALAQPALFAVEYALAGLLMDRGVPPSALLGHSIGEYVAACLAGVFGLDDALALVAARGRLMSRMPAGSMLALWAGEDEALELLAPYGGELGLAAINGRQRTVVSGPTPAIEALEASVAGAGGRCRRLRTSHAFHSPMMAPAAERFRAEVARVALRPPELPFVSNVTGTWIRDEEATDPGYWADHLLRPVRFAAGLDALRAESDPVLLEVGPGNALTTLANAHCGGKDGRNSGPAAVAAMRHPDDPRPDDAVLLGALGRLFTLGVELDGRALFRGERRFRVPLPSYPFERSRYWIDRVDAGASAGRGRGTRITKEPDLDRWFYLPSWKSVLPPPAPASEDVAARTSERPWVVFADDAGLGEALAGRLLRAGARVAVVRDRPGGPFEGPAPEGPAGEGRWTIDARREDDSRRLLAEIGATLGTPGVLVHLWSVGDDPPGPAAAGDELPGAALFRRWQDRGYYSLLSLTAALSEAAARDGSEGEEVALLAVSSRLHDVRGEGRSIPEKAPLLGAALVIPQEHRNVACRAVDLDTRALSDPDGTAGRLLAEAAELLTPADGPRDAVIAWRGGGRLARAYERTPLGPSDREAGGVWGGFRERGVYLVTGGLGAVGTLVAGHLARAHRARLMLAGRSALPAREGWDAWLAERGADDPVSRKIRAVRELEAAGAEVEVAAADVTDPVRAAALVHRTVERFGGLDGVIHLAGALAGDSIYRPLVAIGRASEEQFAPKAHALYALEAALDARVAAGAPPELCLLFSSNASVLGGLGFAAYAAANGFVDAFAAHRDGRDGVRWLSAGWDEWPAQAIEVDLETGMSELAMTAEEGGEALERLAASGVGGHVVVATGDLDLRLDLWVRRDPALVHRAGGSHARPALDTAYEEPRDELETRVAAVWQELLGIETVGIHDNFFDLGGHSLLATQLLSRLRQELGVELELQRLFEGPTVAGVAAAAAEAGSSVDSAVGSAAVGPAPATGPVGSTEPSPGAGRAPLSFAQERMWFLDRMDPGSSAYNLLTPARIEGPLDLPVLARAFDEVVRRHGSLRTTFAVPDGGDDPLGEGVPVQVIQGVAERIRVALPVVDLSALPGERREPEALRLASAVRELPFDLERGPLLRVAVARLESEVHALLLVLHHIVSDGWSMAVLIDELVRSSAAFAAGEPSPLEPLPLQYAEFAAWQRGHLAGEVLDEHLAYWRERLGGDPPALRLPTDRPRTAFGPQPFRAAVEGARLDPAAWSRVRALGRREGATPFMVLLAGFQTLLYRLSGTEDLLVGCPIANRNRREIEGLIGFFLNTLVLRTKPAGTALGECGFRDLLARVVEASVGAFAHQDLPLETVLQRTVFQGSGPEDRSGAGRGMSFFRAMFLFQNMPAPDLELEDLTVSALRPESRIDLGTAIFDVCLAAEEVAEEGGEGLALWMTYNAELFEPATVRRMLAWLERLLTAAAEAPDRSLDALPLLDAAERRRLLAWGAGAESPAEESGPGERVHERITALAADAPERPALFAGPDAGEAVSYGELVRRSAALAARLARAGAGLEAPVGVCLERSPALVVALLGTLRAGAVYLPLDPAYPESRSRAVLSDAGAAVVVTSAALASRFAGLEGVEILVLGAGGAPAGGTPPGAPAPAPPVVVPAESAAYLVYTSGSTGTPKGVSVEHRALERFVTAARASYPVGPEDRVLQFASIGFDTSIEEILPALTAGAAVVLRDEEMLAGASAFVDGCRRAGASVVDLPTAWFHELVTAMEAEDVTLGPPVRLVILGGERALSERLDAFRRRLAPGVRVLNTYGPTEATVVATSCEPLVDDPDGPATGGEPPIGRPLPGATAHVVDRRFELAPPGVFGELVLGGGALARGYRDRPGPTAERFVPDPFAGPGSPGARLYRTGDRARWRADGLLEFGGRIDQQLKVRGYRVEPGEIEARLTEHPGVRQAVVVGRADGDGPTRLVAYVVPRGGSGEGGAEDPGADALRAFAAERLPDYMVPADWVVLSTLPLTPTGKVDRRALPPLEGAGDLLGERTGRAAPSAGPEALETPAEEAVAEIFETVLGVDGVGPDDDFFRLGGHSLLLPRVLHAVRRAFQVEVPLRAVYEEPTVAGLAALVEEMVLEEIERLEPAG